MGSFSVDVDGSDLGDVTATLQFEADEATGKLEKIIAKYTLLIVRDAKRNAPVDTGRLRASIRPVLEDLAATITAGGDIAGTNVKYAAAQEFGTEDGVPATKYLTRAYKKHKDNFESDVKDALSDFGS